MMSATVVLQMGLPLQDSRIDRLTKQIAHDDFGMAKVRQLRQRFSCRLNHH